MAHDEDSPGMRHDIGLNGLTYALAGLAGLGVVLMIAALASGVVETSVPAQTGVEPTDGGAMALLFGFGLIAFVSGAVAWFFVVRPDQHFDNIDIPLDDGHGHGHDEAHHEEQALVVAEGHTPVANPTHHGH